MTHVSGRDRDGRAGHLVEFFCFLSFAAVVEPVDWRAFPVPTFFGNVGRSVERKEKPIAARCVFEMWKE